MEIKNAREMRTNALQHFKEYMYTYTICTFYRWSENKTGREDKALWKNFEE